MEKAAGPQEDPIVIQFHEGMTTKDVAKAIADELTLDENDFHLSLEGKTLGSEDVIPPSAELLLMPFSFAGKPQGKTQGLMSEKQEKLFTLLDSEFDAHYPNDITSIQSLTKISSDAGYASCCKKRTVLKFIQNRFGVDIKIAEEIYSTIWSKIKPYDYKDIEEFVKSKGGKLITTEKEWNKMDGPPSKRKLTIKNDVGQEFYCKPYDLIYKNVWGKINNQWKTEAIMRLFMEEIFGVKFPQTNLRKAYGIQWNFGGNLKFDGYASEIIVNGKKFRIAFEYDGIQHDKYPNYFHKTESDFKKGQRYDEFKNRVAEASQTVLIRLKADLKFTINSLNRFEDGIIQQFYDQTGISIRNRGLVYNPALHIVTERGSTTNLPQYPSKSLNQN